MLLEEDMPQVDHAEMTLRLISQVLNRGSQQLEHLRSEDAWQDAIPSRLLVSPDDCVALAAPLSRLLKLALPIILC